MAPGSPNLQINKMRDPFDIDRAFEELDSIKNKIGTTKSGRASTIRTKNMLSTGNLPPTEVPPLSDLRGGGRKR